MPDEEMARGPHGATEPHEDAASVEPTDNPLAGGLNISVSVPESIEIKMVDASVLNDYEVWVFIASLLSSGFIGFLVGTVQAYDINAPTKAIWRGVTIIIGLLFVVACGRAWNQRKRLSKRSKNVSLKVVGAGQG
jgi:hypothetical protein